MNTKNTVFSRLFDADKHRELKLKAEKKLELGLVNELDYEYDTLQDEVSRLAYSTEEWFEENFDKFVEIRATLRDVYINYSESFIDPVDVEADNARLIDMKSKADELGVSIIDIYPDYDEHMQLIKDLDYFTERFVNQQDELRNFGL